MAAHHAICAVAFVDSAARIGTREALGAWLEYDLAYLRPSSGWSRVHEGPAFQDCASAGALELRSLLGEARRRVVDTLAAWLDDPTANAFQLALVSAGHVRLEPGVGWVPVVGTELQLSELVLRLFAADMMERHDVYAARLCVCKQCGRLSFEPSVSERRGCPDHPDHVARYERQIQSWRTGTFSTGPRRSSYPAPAEPVPRSRQGR